MKYTWEKDDIIPGRRVLSHNKSEEYIIAYDPVMSEFKYALVSLKDGMIVCQKTGKYMLVNDLNDNGMLPCTIK